MKRNQIMITALAIMLAIAGYLQFAGNNLEDEYLAVDNQAVENFSDEIKYTEIESLDSEVNILMDDYLDEDMVTTGVEPEAGCAEEFPWDTYLQTAKEQKEQKENKENKEDFPCRHPKKHCSH